MEAFQSAPYYKKIKQELYSRIQNGDWGEGDRLPSEKKLCEEFGVSRITVRQAIWYGVNEGFLETYPGKGTFVKKRKASRGFIKNKDFSTMIREMGKEPRSEILDYQTISSAIQNPKLIEIFDTKRIINLVILGLGDDEPSVYYSSFFPYELGTKMVEKAKERVSKKLPFSTYDLYGDGVGVAPSKAHQTYEAVQVDKRIAQILKIPFKSPGFLIKSVFYTLDDKPLEYREGVYRGDRFVFHVTREF